MKGKNNVVADALSRRPSPLSLSSISTDWRALLLVEYSKNKFACELLDGQIQDDRYRIVDDIIYYKNRIYLVPESTLRKKIIQAAHDSPLSGHQGCNIPNPDIFYFYTNMLIQRGMQTAKQKSLFYRKN